MTTLLYYNLLNVLLLLMIVVHGDNITIDTNLGAITGRIEDNYVIFRGISYTEFAPIGQYRFSESMVKTTPYNDIYDATEFKSVCMQSPGAPPEEQPMDEDCLYLNIWTPNIDINNGTIINNLLPVLFWIHGGGFVRRSGSLSLFNGKTFMSNMDVVYVSINYRLGSLGFLSLETILEENGRTSGGMNGINDMMVALQWVQDNINDYGGDPNQVTIFGESAGGTAVCTLLTTQYAANVFSKAIIQSGSCLSGTSYQNGLMISQNALKNSNLTDDLAVLRTLNASKFLEFAIKPSTDNYILTDTLYNIFTGDPQTFQLNADKLIIGFTSMDTLTTFPYFLENAIQRAPENNNELTKYVQTYIDNGEQIKLLQDIYYPINDFASYSYNNTYFTEYNMLWYSINADVCFICPAMYFAAILLQNDNIGDNFYLYNFLGPSYPYYVPHAGELPFLFNNSNFAESFWGTSWNYNLSYFITETWRNYAIYGHPNSTIFPAEWIPFSVDGTAMSFQDNNGEIKQVYGNNYRNGVCDFWITEVGVDVMSTLCAQSISVAMDDEGGGLGTWLIVVISVGMFAVFMIVLILRWRLRLYYRQQRKEYYTQMMQNDEGISNEMPIYGATSK